MPIHISSNMSNWTNGGFMKQVLWNCILKESFMSDKFLEKLGSNLKAQGTYTY